MKFGKASPRDHGASAGRRPAAQSRDRAVAGRIEPRGAGLPGPRRVAPARAAWRPPGRARRRRPSAAAAGCRAAPACAPAARRARRRRRGGSPVRNPPSPWHAGRERLGRLEHALQQRVRHRPHGVERRGERAQRRDRGRRVRRGAGPDDDDRDERRAVQGRGHERRGRRVEQREAAAEVVGRGGHQLGVGGARPRRRAPPARPAGRRRRRPTGYSSNSSSVDDAEARPAAAQRPQQLRMLVRARGHEPAVGRDHARARAASPPPARACARASPSRSRA